MSMTARELRELKDVELGQKLVQLREENFRLRFRSASEAIENPTQLRYLRREIARVKTVLLERERALPRERSQETKTNE